MTAPGAGTPAAAARMSSRRRDLVRVMHHTHEVLPNGYGYPSCEQPGRRSNVTTDLAEVTCKRCRKILAKLREQLAGERAGRLRSTGERDEARAGCDDYAARLRATDESWTRLAAERDGLRDRIDSLALGLEMSASTTAPSRKSEIESGCASALRGLLRIDGESDDDTRQRLERERGGTGLIAIERQRQISEEGYTAEHDREHEHGELARAAGVYALRAAGTDGYPGTWPPGWRCKSGTPMEMLVKAGALIAAEIDRLLASGSPDGGRDGQP